VAFLEESDLNPPAPQAQVVQRPAKGRLVPALLITLVVLNLVAIPVVILFATGVIVMGGAAKGPAPAGIAALDPASLVTPTGRRLDAREFGGFVFEVTRIVYSSDPRLNSVTITVPGQPPRQGVFRIGDSFAGGQLRVVDITSSAVVLEHNGEQQSFLVEGADPSSIWERAPSGPQIIPPRNTDAIPNLPVGQVRPPDNPIVEESDDPDDQESTPAKKRIPEGTALEDLPIEVPAIPLRQADFQIMITTLPDLLSRDFVFGQALDASTMAPIGARILRIHAESIFSAHGMLAGDDIVLMNEHEIRRPADLTDAARTITGADELQFVLWRGHEKYIYTFYRSTAAE
jgi:hypothetical protein